MKEREGKRGEEREQQPEQQVFEDRREDKEWRTYMGTDIRKTCLKTGRQTENGNPTKGSLKRERGKRGEEQEQRSEQQVSEERREGREQRTYMGIDIRKTSLKIIGET